MRKWILTSVPAMLSCQKDPDSPTTLPEAKVNTVHPTIDGNYIFSDTLAAALK